MRQSWVMRLKPGCEDEYKKRHDDLWPEMAEALRRGGCETSRFTGMD